MTVFLLDSGADITIDVVSTTSQNTVCDERSFKRYLKLTSVK